MRYFSIEGSTEGKRKAFTNDIIVKSIRRPGMVDILVIQVLDCNCLALLFPSSNLSLLSV